VTLCEHSESISVVRVEDEFDLEVILEGLVGWCMREIQNKRIDGVVEKGSEDQSTP